MAGRCDIRVPVLLSSLLPFPQPAFHNHTQEPIIEPPTDISPYNATFNGNFTDLNPGSNISSYYLYGDCDGFPTGASSTPVQTITSVDGSGELPSFTVGDLEPNTTYCVSVCIQDDTAGSGYICTAPESFDTLKAPEVISNPPYDVGAYPGSRRDAQPVMPVR